MQIIYDTTPVQDEALKRAYLFYTSRNSKDPISFTDFINKRFNAFFASLINEGKSFTAQTLIKAFDAASSDQKAQIEDILKITTSAVSTDVKKQ